MLDSKININFTDLIKEKDDRIEELEAELVSIYGAIDAIEKDNHQRISTLIQQRDRVMQLRGLIIELNDNVSQRCSAIENKMNEYFWKLTISVSVIWVSICTVSFFIK